MSKISKAVLELVEVCEWEYTERLTRKAFLIMDAEPELATAIATMVEFVESTETMTRGRDAVLDELRCALGLAV